jgi:hypothetical protein
LSTDTRTHDRGPLPITRPVRSTISLRAVTVTVPASVLASRFEPSVLRVLGICAGTGAGLYLATTRGRRTTP